VHHFTFNNEKYISFVLELITLLASLITISASLDA
jgi:hypothetical protein